EREWHVPGDRVAATRVARNTDLAGELDAGGAQRRIIIQLVGGRGGRGVVDGGFGRGGGPRIGQRVARIRVATPGAVERLAATETHQSSHASIGGGRCVVGARVHVHAVVRRVSRCVPWHIGAVGWGVGGGVTR